MGGDLQTIFREFMRLDRRRVQSSLTVAEFKRWSEYKGFLNHKLQPASDETKSLRRESLRIPISLDVSYENCDEIGEFLMTNLSRGGIFVASDQLLEVGTKLGLRIRVREMAQPIELEAEVVSHNVGRDLLVQESGMGLRFVNLTDFQKLLIDELYQRSASQAVSELAESLKET
jgi:uncharacterized protein (TIGR02266 family)